MTRITAISLLLLCFFSFTIAGSADSTGQKAGKQAAKTSGNASRKKAAVPERRTWTGILIDNHCVELHRDSLDRYIKTHTRECMQKNGKGKFSLYVPELKKAVPICMEMGGCYQGYVDRFNEGLKIEITGYWKGDSIYSEMYHAVP